MQEEIFNFDEQIMVVSSKSIHHLNPVAYVLITSNLPGYEEFNFHNGILQPDITSCSSISWMFFDVHRCTFSFFTKQLNSINNYKRWSLLQNHFLYQVFRTEKTWCSNRSVSIAAFLFCHLLQSMFYAVITNEQTNMVSNIWENKTKRDQKEKKKDNIYMRLMILFSFVHSY